MSLVRYKKKRSFEETPEPTGGQSSGSKLRFVVQKHDASHLHYDFRLEMEGVLKSWAVPKGPSLDTSVKRLAMMVEDHPFDYRTFEGVIPKGNYGAGTVMVWDEGFYQPAELDKKTSKEEMDKMLRRQLHSGKIKFVLNGKKLKGLFALVKASGRGENSWLLMKLDDKYASSDDVLLHDRSVVSRRTMAGIGTHPARIYGEKSPSLKRTKSTSAKAKESSVKAAKSTPERGAKSSSVKRAGKSSVKRVAGKKAINASTRQAVKQPGRTKAQAKKRTVATSRRITPKRSKAGDISGGRNVKPSGSPKGKFPSLQPMLATLVDKPFHKEGWVYEVKWDGYRALGFVQNGNVELMSRNAKTFNEKFYPIYDELSQWNMDAIVDGEVLVLDERGHSNFGALQNWRSEADGMLIYYVFDLLWLKGTDLTHLPLTERKKMLAKAIPWSDSVRMSESFEMSGIELYAVADKLGLEGLIAKRADSIYEAGRRSPDWLKIKVKKRQEVVIGGFTLNEGSDRAFSSLLVGVHDGKQLTYIGKVGTGFNGEMQTDMMKQFKPRIVSESPFDVEPDVNKPSRFRPSPPAARATWLKPELVCEVSFTEMTSDGVMRHPSFEGMRDDKKASTVVRETPMPTESLVNDEPMAKRVVKATTKQARKTLLNPKDETQVREVGGHELKFTNLSKIYWPESDVSKREMINYYYQVAPYLLPYLKDRPQSLNRFPNGINGKSFYQKDVTGKVPDWVERFLYHSSDSTEDKHFMVPQSEADILLMANMGCIELHPWSSTIQTPDNPDWCIIDLDPGKNTFDQVIEAALVTKDVLDEIGLKSHCKTSGSTGMHIYIPMAAQYTYEESKEFARAVVTVVNQRIPSFTSIERIVSNRKGKMYLDFLQNRPQATLAAPYSLRPKPGATVSMPLYWEEVKKGLTMKDFTIFNAVERLRSEGDIFKPVIGKAIKLEKPAKKLEAMLKESKK
ncbi:DNA ligase D [Chryseolinea sp. T2]|uniref:DNA ligase D n=1 Tax=Chryseolinea sp. T2 TaxID=3129255 RepID=UPI003077B051